MATAAAAAASCSSTSSTNSNDNIKDYIRSKSNVRPGTHTMVNDWSRLAFPRLFFYLFARDVEVQMSV